jgi:hypothetical protein
MLIECRWALTRGDKRTGENNKLRYSGGRVLSKAGFSNEIYGIITVS